MKIRILLSNVLLILLLTAAARTCAQVDIAYGFAYTHSSDSSDWRTFTRPTTTTMTASVVALDLGFDYPFYGHTYNKIIVANTGYIGLTTDSAMSQYNGGVYINTQDPIISMLFRDLTSYSPYATQTISTVRTQALGYNGDHTFVAEFTVLCGNPVDTIRYQLQLGEYEGSVRVLIAPLESDQMNCMFCISLGNGIGQFGARVDNDNLTVTPDYYRLSGRWRNYLFTPMMPVCPDLRQLSVEDVTHTSARVSWHPNVLHGHYVLEYGPAGFADGQGTRIVTPNSSLLLTDLQSGVLYEARVSAPCLTGAPDRTASCQFRTYCSVPHGNQIYFANLHDSSVVCKIGLFQNPDQMQLVADYGPASISSRHTVHYDMLETDPRTGNQLLTIPNGHCMSVRLGNWHYGAQQESVTYNLHVDSNDYDLLILRYAVVEENPDHPLNMQPKFLFSINDSAGNPIGSCYTANFVSGSATGWNSYRPSDNAYMEILWRDWEAVGVDLAPLHGRNIQVKLSNYDCNAGGHYGYAYYTLESSRKTFETTLCGDAASNTFIAPAGFHYRWYSEDAPGVTLSTTNQLQVNGTGSYGCWVSYNLSGSSCGFTMSTTAGPRYPAAIFQSSALDACGSTVQFVNHSCVSADQVHGSLTSEPCTQYLWRFGDGTTSEAVNPIHTFPNGTFTVELVAMLSNGACRDSVQQTIHVNMAVDTQQVILCPGTQYLFYDRLISDSGRYVYTENCQEHVLECSLYEVSEAERYDTICEGDALTLGDTAFAAEGRHRYAVPDRHYCDSVQWVNLTIKPVRQGFYEDTLLLGDSYFVNGAAYPAPASCEVRLPGTNGCDSIVTLRLSCIDQRDSTVCNSSLPLMWDSITFAAAGTDTIRLRSSVATDSLVVHQLAVRYPPQFEPEVSRSCTPPAYYTVRVPSGWRYTWQSDPVDSVLLRQQPDTIALLSPSQATDYSITADYRDAPSCPSTLTLPLQVMRYLVADLYVSPPWLSIDQLEFLAVDQSSNSTDRQWFVDGQRQWDGDVHFGYTADAKADSVVLMLRVENGSCEDSVTRVLPIYHYTLAFPNVFTPGAETNNRFGCTATHIGDYGLWIYDRRGALVFSTHDQRQTWDGTAHGVPCQQGAYTYHCQYSIPVAGMQTKVGTVLLLR